MMNLGVETELYIVRESSIGDRAATSCPSPRTGSLRPTQAYDVEATIDAMGFLDPMVKAMQETGFGVFSFDAEGGDGQYEFDFEYAPALEMADRITFFRLLGEADRQAGGPVRDVHAEAVHRARGARARTST